MGEHVDWYLVVRGKDRERVRAVLGTPDHVSGDSDTYCISDLIPEKTHLEAFLVEVERAPKVRHVIDMKVSVHFIGIPSYGGRIYLVEAREGVLRGARVPFAEIIERCHVERWDATVTSSAIRENFSVIEVDGRKLYVCRRCHGVYFADPLDALDHLRDVHQEGLGADR